MRNFLLIVFAVCSSVLAVAQKNETFKLSVGPQFAVATSKYFSDYWGAGIGASAQAEYFFNKNISATGSFGILNYSGKNNNGVPSGSILPLMAGLRYYLIDGLNVGAQAGVGFISGGIGSGAGFAYSPQVDYVFNIHKKKTIDAGIQFNGCSFDLISLNSVGLRVAYIF